MSRIPSSRRLRSAFVLAAAALLAGCCEGGTCIKDPPCRPCEDPCCLTPVQRTALEKGTHAVPGAPVVYLYEEKTFVLFTEKGVEEFEKDPMSYDEKGALRLVRGGRTWRVDIDPGDGVDFPALGASARPYSPRAK
jgi:hypothetical protein